MTRKFTAISGNFRFFKFSTLAFVLLPNTNASSRTWSNGQPIFDQHACVSTGGYVPLPTDSGSVNGSDLPVYNSVMTYHSIFTYAATFSAVTSITYTAKYNDSRTAGIHFALATNDTNWTTNSDLIGGFPTVSAATSATETYIILLPLTGKYKYIRVNGITGNSYLNINALRTNKAK